jgi:hypothetical protein
VPSSAAVEYGGPLRSGYGDGYALSFIDCVCRSLRVQPSRFYRAGRATTRLTLKASPSLTILAQMNSQIQNELDPQSDNGAPGGSSQATPGDQPGAGGEMQAKPTGGGDSEQNEIDQEEGK